MYQIKIDREIDILKEIVIPNGQQLIDVNNQPVLDQEGNPSINISGQDIYISVEKTSEEIAAEEQALKDEKYAEIQAKIDAYKAKQEYQRKHGGPGPVAEFEIMKIANEYNGQFEVIFEEE